MPNGATLLYDKRQIPVATIFVATRFGSAYEPVEFKGIAHFIEHMIFKGTKKRDQEQITHEIESVGGEINAFTSDQITSVYAKMPKEHFEKGIDVVSDMAFNSVFSLAEIEKERKVIFEEIKRRHDSPPQYVLGKLKEMLYSPPFGLSRLGTIDSLSRAKRKQLLDYYKYYSLDNLIFAVVGDVPKEEVKRAVLKHMPKIKKNPLPQVNPIPHLRDHSELRKDLHQAHIALGFHAPTFSQRKRYAAEIFDCILGRGMSSRLWQEIREKRGLAYTVHSYLSQEKDYGFEAIYVGTSKDKLKEVEEIALKQARSLEKVDSKEVEEAKENLIGSHEVASEKSDDIAINLLLNEIATNAEEYYKYPERISDVKLSEVRELAKIKGYAKVTLAPR